MADDILSTVRRLEGSGDDAVSPKGAVGRYQIMPDTARQYGLDPSRLSDPQYSEQAAQVVLDDLSKRFNGDPEAMLIGYNAGPGVAKRWLASGRDNSILPNETQKYLANSGYSGNQGVQTMAMATPTDSPSGASVDESPVDNMHQRDFSPVANAIAETDSIVAGFRAKEASSRGATDYVGNADPETIWSNSAFLADLRSYYADKGFSGTDADLRRQWYSDRNFKDLNTFSMAKDAIEAISQDDSKRPRDARLVETWRKMPAFWEKGGRSAAEMALDVAPALLSDPVNFVPFAGWAAKGVARSALKGATTLAGAQALEKGALIKGILAGTATDAALNAGIGGASSFIEQTRDKALGIRPGISAKEILLSSALGGAAGAVLGGLGSVGSAGEGVAAGKLGAFGKELETKLGGIAEQTSDTLATMQGNSAQLGEAADAARSQLDPSFVPNREAAVTESLKQRRADLEEDYNRQLAAGEDETQQDTHAFTQNMMDAVDYAQRIPLFIDQLNAQKASLQAKNALDPKIEEINQQIRELTKDRQRLLRADTEGKLDDFLDEYLVRRQGKSEAKAPSGGASVERATVEFTPTDQWQDVPPDAVLPPGLQIEADMNTGAKRARWPVGSEQAQSFAKQAAEAGEPPAVAQPQEKLWTPSDEELDTIADPNYLAGQRTGGAFTDIPEPQAIEGDELGLMLSDIDELSGGDLRTATILINTLPEFQPYADTLHPALRQLKEAELGINDPMAIMKSRVKAGELPSWFNVLKAKFGKVFDSLDGEDKAMMTNFLEGLAARVEKGLFTANNGIKIATSEKLFNERLDLAMRDLAAGKMDAAKPKADTRLKETPNGTGGAQMDAFSVGEDGTIKDLAAKGAPRPLVKQALSQMLREMRDQNYLGRELPYDNVLNPETGMVEQRFKDGKAVRADARDQLRLAQISKTGVKNAEGKTVVSGAQARKTITEDSQGRLRRTEGGKTGTNPTAGLKATERETRDAIDISINKQIAEIANDPTLKSDEDRAARKVILEAERAMAKHRVSEQIAKEMERVKGDASAVPTEKPKADGKVATSKAVGGQQRSGNLLDTIAKEESEREAAFKAMQEVQRAESAVAGTVARHRVIAQERLTEWFEHNMEQVKALDVPDLAKADTIRALVEFRRARELELHGPEFERTIKEFLLRYRAGAKGMNGLKHLDTLAIMSSRVKTANRDDIKALGELINAGKISIQEYQTRVQAIVRRYAEAAAPSEKPPAVGRELLEADATVTPVQEVAKSNVSAELQNLESQVPEGGILAMMPKEGTPAYNAARAKNKLGMETLGQGRTVQQMVGSKNLSDWVFGYTKDVRFKSNGNMRNGRAMEAAFTPFSRETPSAGAITPVDAVPAKTPNFKDIKNQKLESGLTVVQAAERAFNLETTAVETAADFATRSAELAKLWATIPDFRIEGVNFDTIKASFKKIFTEKHDPEAYFVLRDMLQRLDTKALGDSFPAVEFGLGGEGGMFSFDLAGRGKIDMSLRGTGGTRGLLGIATHELGHWFYLNVLSNADKAKFWSMMSEKLKEAKDATSIDAFLQQKSPAREALRNMNVDARALYGDDFGKFPGANVPVGKGSAHATSEMFLTEIFANQFWEYVYTKGRGSVDATFFEKVVGWVRKVMDAIMGDNRVDPEVAAMIGKYMPDDAKARLGDPSIRVAKSAEGKEIFKDLGDLDKVHRGLIDSQDRFRQEGEHLDLRANTAATVRQLAAISSGRELPEGVAKKISDAIEEFSRAREDNGLKLLNASNDAVEAAAELRAHLDSSYIKAESGRAPVSATEALRPSTFEMMADNTKQLTSSLMYYHKDTTDALDRMTKAYNDLLTTPKGTPGTREVISGALEDMMRQMAMVSSSKTIIGESGSKLYNPQLRNALKAASREIYETIGGAASKGVSMGDVELKKTIEAQQDAAAMWLKMNDDSFDPSSSQVADMMGGVRGLVAAMPEEELRTMFDALAERGIVLLTRSNLQMERRLKSLDMNIALNKHAQSMRNPNIRFKRKAIGDGERAALKDLESELMGQTNGKVTRAESSKAIPLKDLGDDDLFDALTNAQKVENREGAKTVAALAREIRRRAQTRVPTEKMKIPVEIMRLSKEELVMKLNQARQQGDNQLAKTVWAELFVRSTDNPKVVREEMANKNLAKMSSHMSVLDVETSVVRRALRAEATASRESMTDYGVPGYDVPELSEIVAGVTHRDKDVQDAARTMMQRVARMTLPERLTLDTEVKVTNSDLAHIANRSAAMGDETKIDLDNDIYREARNLYRRLAVTLVNGSGDANDAIGRLGSIILNTRSFSDGERALIRKAFAQADGDEAKAVRSAFSGMEGEDSDMRMAREWMGKKFAQYASGKTSPMGAFGGMEDARALGGILERMQEPVSFTVNGVIGREDVRTTFWPLHAYGDMFAAYRLPRDWSNTLGPNVPAFMIEDYVANRLQSFTKAQWKNIFRYTGDFDYNGGQPMVVYHGTPNASHIKRGSPESYMHMSPSGTYGPGGYVTVDGRYAGRYRDEGTVASIDMMSDAHKYTSLSKGQKMEAQALTSELRDLRQELAEREFYLKAARQGATSVGRRGSGLVINDVLGVTLSAPTRDGKIAELLDHIDSLHNEISAKVEALQQIGAVPGVVPMFLKKGNYFDLTRTWDMTSNADAGTVAKLLDGLGADHDVFVRALGQNDLGSLDGATMYDALVQARAAVDDETTEQAQAAVSEIMKANGFDGMRVNEVVDKNNTALSFVVFPTDKGFETNFDYGHVPNLKHIDAEEFNANSKFLFKSRVATQTIGGAAVREAMESTGKLTPQKIPQLLGMVRDATGNPDLAQAFADTTRGRVTQKALDTLREHSPLNWFMGSVEYVRDKIGAKWMGDLMAPSEGTGIVEQLALERGRRLEPSMALVSQIDGKSGMREWFDYVRSGGQPPQSERLTQVVQAVRRADPTGLTGDQVKLYNHLNQSFANELKSLRANGVKIGYIPKGYFPQVWNAGRIEQKRAMFELRLADYFKKEAIIDGRKALSEEEALAKARGVTQRITDDNGVWVPPRAEKRASNMDADFQRMIRLDDPKFRKELDALEPFLESDIRSVMSKYIDESTLRGLTTEKFGQNMHGFFDYMTIAQEGRTGAIDLLMTDKIINKRYNYVSGDNVVRPADVQLDVIKGFKVRKHAEDAIDNVIAQIEQGGRDNLPRQVVMEKAMNSLMNMKSPVSQGYAKRVEAVVNGLMDFGWTGNALNAQELGQVETTFRRMLRKTATLGQTYGDAAHRTSQMLKDVNSVSLLGFTTLTSLSDVVLPLIRSGSFTAYTKGWAKYANDPEWRTALRNIGLSVHRTISKNVPMVYARDGSPKMQAFFEGIGLGKWTAVQREIAGSVGFETLVAAQRKVQRGINEGNQNTRSFRNAFQTLREFGLSDYAQHGSPSIESIGLAGDDAIKRAVLRFANEAVFEPGFQDKPLWAQGPVGSLVFQLKSYPLMFQKMTGRVMRQAGSYISSGGQQGSIAPLMYLMTLGAGAGMTANGLKDIVQSRGGADQASPEFRERQFSKLAEQFGVEVEPFGSADKAIGWYVEGLMIAGGLGLIGNMFYDTAQQLDNGAYGFQRAMSGIFGPSVGLAFDTFNVAAGGADALTHGEDNGVAAERQGVRSLAGRIPIVGGIKGLRDKIVDTVAGEASGDSPFSESSSGFGNKLFK